MAENTNYLTHLLSWMLPVVLLQWIIAWKILLRNWKAVVFPTLILGTYYSLSDLIAISNGIWYIDANQTIGLGVGPLPIEEILFFFITSLLVAQSLVMFLPKNLRH